MAFAQWLRTGILADPEDIERKFNPNHDPADGRFTFGPGGASAALRQAARRTTHLGTSAIYRSRKIYPVDLRPLSDGDKATVDQIASSPTVVRAMDEAWAQTLMTPHREHGFMIYSDGKVLEAGPIQVGSAGSLPAMTRQRYGADPLHGHFDYAVAWFHTHPGDYPGAYRASNPDQRFGTMTRTITIVRTRKGFVIGR